MLRAPPPPPPPPPPSVAMLDRAGVAALVPHRGAMCLLDAITAWDATRISALALAHRDPANPLRRGGMLPAVCGVELALQAMAAHGALRGATGGSAPQRPGYLASLREVDLAAERLDDIPGPLLVSAESLGSEPHGFLYRFRIEGGGRQVLAGRAAILLPPAAPA